MDASTSLRALIVDLALSGGADDEIYDACGVLGRLIAQRGGSPTLASLTIDHACDALGAREAPWMAPARAAVAEGFAMALTEEAKREAAKGWEFPGCAVTIGDSALALAAGHPSDDDEVLAAWAARVANAAALKGVRRAIVAGPDRPRAALAEALTVAGIDTRLV
ncbi:MAG: hypothetical protein ACLP1X_08515 [Polyangiaceae bacterium]